MWLFSPDLSLTPISQADQPMTLKNNTTTRGGGGGSSRRRESYALKRRTNLTTHLADLRTRKCEHCISKAIVTTVTQDHVATGCADTAVVQVANCECTFKKWDLTLKKSWQLFFSFFFWLAKQEREQVSICRHTSVIGVLPVIGRCLWALNLGVPQYACTLCVWDRRGNCSSF